jgi:HSP20 family molecular chaperone IbpA
MALIRFEQFDPVSNMLALRQALDRFVRNPSFNSGVSGHRAYPPVNILDDRDGVVVIADLPGMDPTIIKVSGQGKTLTLSGTRLREDDGSRGTTIVGNAVLANFALNAIVGGTRYSEGRGPLRGRRSHTASTQGRRNQATTNCSAG